MPCITDQSTIKKREISLQQMQFVNFLFSPDIMFNASEAYRRAYPKAKSGHNKLSTRLMANEGIKTYIADKRALISKQTGYSIEQAQIEYEEARLLSIQLNQPAAAVSAVTGKARLYALDRDAGGGEKTVIIIAPKVVSAKPVISKEIEHE